MTQNESILAYLKSHDGITTLESCDRLRVFRLSERIRELTDMGYSFSHTPETTQSGARVIRYRLQSPVALPSSPVRVSPGAVVTVPDVLRVDGWDYKGRPMVRYVEGFGPGWPPDQDHLHR